MGAGSIISQDERGGMAKNNDVVHASFLFARFSSESDESGDTGLF
jgi:hypothetical protein